MVMYSPAIENRQNASRSGMSLLQSVLHLLTDTELYDVQTHIALELHLRSYAAGGSYSAGDAQRGGVPCANG